MESGDSVASPLPRKCGAYRNSCGNSHRRNGGKTDEDDSPIYLDFNATTPMAPEVKAAVIEAMDEGWANPSSNYAFGRAAESTVASARLRVAKMLNAASPEHVIFTSGGTEADNWVIHSALTYFERHRHRYGRYRDNKGGDEEVDLKPHVVTTNFEHDAVKLPLEELQRRGKIDVSFLAPVNGQVSPSAVLAALRPSTCLVTIMLANNEIGAVQPVAEMVDNVKRYPGSGRIFFHTDAAQAIGKIPTDVAALGVDFLTLVGHKFYGPRIGALYVRSPLPLTVGDKEERTGTPLAPLFHGGGQERGYRPGTENTPMIAGLGVACELVTSHLQRDNQHMSRLLHNLESQLKHEFDQSDAQIVFNSKFFRHDGSPVPRLPNTCNVTFRPPSAAKKLVTGKELVASSGIAASVGAACHGHSSTPSSVLLAFGVDADDASAAIRLSLGRGTTENEILRAVALLKSAYNRLYFNV